MNYKPFHQRWREEGKDLDVELFGVVKELIEDSRAPMEESRSRQRMAAIKKHAIDAIKLCKDLDEAKEGSGALQLGKFAAAVHKLESKGMSQGEILGFMAKAAEVGALPGVQVFDAEGKTT